MAVVLRLQRIGKRVQPHYRIVAIEKSRGPRSEPLEVIGHYDPKAKESAKIAVNENRLEYWLKNGAAPSETLQSLLNRVRRKQNIERLEQPASKVEETKVEQTKTE